MVANLLKSIGHSGPPRLSPTTVWSSCNVYSSKCSSNSDALLERCHWTVVAAVTSTDWLDHLTDQNRLIYSGIESCGDILKCVRNDIGHNWSIVLTWLLANSGDGTKSFRCQQSRQCMFTQQLHLPLRQKIDSFWNRHLNDFLFSSAFCM